MTKNDMDRRTFLKVQSVGTAAALLGCSSKHQDEAGKRPNVLLIFDDQLRADVLGVYGGRNITTPHLDRLASQGVTFTNAISSCPLCTPYRGMLHTGRYPTHSGILLNFVEASAVQNPNCLANVFQRAGYDTGFIGKWHLSAGWLKQEGKYDKNPDAVAAYRKINPETEYVPPGPERLGYEHWEAFNFHMDFNDYWYYKDELQKMYSEKYETDTQIDQAINYMKSREKADKPFLLTIAPHPPHPPFRPEDCPEGYLDKVPQRIHWSPNVPTDNPRSLLDMRCYLAMAKNVDDNIGRLMAYLDESDLTDNTIVIFTSDHGEMHGSHGRRNKMVPYAEAIDIPLIIRWPGKISTGVRNDAHYTPMDHLPTLCGLADIPIPSEVDGMNLSEVMLKQSRSHRDEVLIANYTSNWNYFQSGTKWPEWRGIRTEQYTYCKWLPGEEELYDNLEDPYQMENLVLQSKEPSLLKRMRERLKDLLAEAHDQFLTGVAYGDWYDDERNLIRTGLGVVSY